MLATIADRMLRECTLTDRRGRRTPLDAGAALKHIPLDRYSCAHGQYDFVHFP